MNRSGGLVLLHEGCHAAEHESHVLSRYRLILRAVYVGQRVSKVFREFRGMLLMVGEPSAQAELWLLGSVPPFQRLLRSLYLLVRLVEALPSFNTARCGRQERKPQYIWRAHSLNIISKLSDLHSSDNGALGTPRTLRRCGRSRLSLVRI